MKTLLFTCCFFAIVLSHATAQVFPRDFQNNINALNTAIAQKNFTGENNAYEQLDIMMNTQIKYLTATVNTLQKTYEADTLRISKDRDKVIDGLKLASAAQGSARNTDMQIVEKLKAAIIDGKNIASKELVTITKQSGILATEQKIYNGLRLLRNNLAANQSKIDDSLNQFEATL